MSADDGDITRLPEPARGKLAENIVHFARALRNAGLAVGPRTVLDAIRAVEAAGITSRDDFYWTLHASFVKKREQHAVFEEAFRLFWRTRSNLRDLLEMLALAGGQKQESEPFPPNAAAARAANALLGEAMRRLEQKEELREIDSTSTVSGEEHLRRRDFAQMTADEIAEANKRIDQLVFSIDKVRTRRFEPAEISTRIDMRRTLRMSLRSGGKLIVPRFRKLREVSPPIVALCDISGSMSPYSRVILHFMHALTEKRRHVHTLLFGTRLTNVTRQLSMRDPDEALGACSNVVEDWSGGTRIATAIGAFNRQWSRRVLGQGAIVLLVTDGLERDTDEDLASEMDRLHRSCRRLIWLNPLLRFDRFEARAHGIRMMLPHVDEFRPIHSLAAIGDLCDALATGRAEDADPQKWLNAA